MTEQMMIPTFIQEHQHGDDAFDWLMQMDGKAYRLVKGRKTIQVSINARSYFIKQHFGVGWREIIKSLLSLKKPVLSALTEVYAIKKLVDIGIPTTPLVAYGQRGLNPAKIQSFVMTEDLGDIISLEALCADWADNPPPAAFKEMLIIELAKLSATLHGAGLCHRDYYLCHFVLKKETFQQGQLDLILIDLHRMLQNQASDSQAVMKDIAALMFSARDCGFVTEDWALFKAHYLPQSAAFWDKVEMRANKMYEKFHSQKFQQRLTAEKSALQNH